MVPILSQKIFAYHQLGENAGVQYIYGAKPPLNPLWVPAPGAVSDCSGWFRYLVYHASLHQLILPEGSADIHDRCVAQGLERVDYHQEAPASGRFLVALMDGSLDPEHERHIWFCHGGMTLECFGGHGVGRRQWNAMIEGHSISLADACSACFVLPTV